MPRKILILTAFHQALLKLQWQIKLDDKFKEIIMSKIPSARLGEPEDIANAVLFLASRSI